jgi:FixJ family two-component response regulator
MQRSLPLIAVVDDEVSVRKALRRLLSSVDLECWVFASGRDFLESLQKRVPDCVVLDLHMPGLTGLDVQRELARTGVKVPAIIITAHDEPANRAQCLSAGAVAYVCKPFDEHALLNVVASAIGKRLSAH